jgi:pimeloyl-ACP methyl ester carboxylesterase
MVGLATLLAACAIGGVPAQCGTVTVPESRALPAGTAISLNVAVLPATVKSQRRADPVFFVVGGPGGVATDAVPWIANAWSDVNGHRDIVFVDQRGVGKSNPLSCAATTQGLSVPDLVAACLGVVNGDVTHYRTTDAMDDLDAVRQALGYAKIDIYGGSYGATAVQVYLRRHAETVRTAVLDGVTLLDVPVFERWSSSGQRALNLLDARCRADRACKRSFPHWYARFPALLARLATKPATVKGVTVDAAGVADTVHELTASAAEAAEVPFLLAKAESGNLAPLAGAIAAVDARAAGQAVVMPAAIMCTEPWAARDPAKAAADAQGTYLAYSDPATALRWQQVCAAWPPVSTAAEDWTRVRSAAPVLVLQGGADPKDPPANSAGVAAVMPNARVILVPGQGHGVSTVGCMPVLLDRFFERGTATGLDTSCAKLTPVPAFRLR